MRMQQAQATHQKEMKQLESDLTKHANQQLEALQKKMDEAVNNAQSSMGSEIQKKDQEIATLKASIETLQAKVRTINFAQVRNLKIFSFLRFPC